MTGPPRLRIDMDAQDRSGRDFGASSVSGVLGGLWVAGASGV